MAQRPPYKRPREDALLEAERSHQRRLIAHLDEKLLDETLRCEERERDNRNLCWRLDRLNDLLDKERERAALAKERVGELERAVLAEVRVDELEEDWTGRGERAKEKKPAKCSNEPKCLNGLKKNRAAALSYPDFLSGLAYGEARRVGGRGRSLPCGCSDGPAASRAALRGCTARGRASVPPASHRSSMRSSSV